MKSTALCQEAKAKLRYRLRRKFQLFKLNSVHRLRPVAFRLEIGIRRTLQQYSTNPEIPEIARLLAASAMHEDIFESVLDSKVRSLQVVPFQANLLTNAIKDMVKVAKYVFLPDLRPASDLLIQRPPFSFLITHISYSRGPNRTLQASLPCEGQRRLVSLV